MCGIAGIVAVEGSRETVAAAVRRMTDALIHRGPDDEGVAIVSAHGGPVACFGHRRLAIIECSHAGHQPMIHLPSGDALTFNGEIYDFRERRAELAALGHAARTRTDTEVILLAHAAWQADAPRRLRGIFAYGHWAQAARRLTLVRDHLGVKPLYYAEVDGMLLFASEVRALLASGLVARRLDADGLRGCLAYGSVQEPLTLVAGVRSVPPGSMLTWEAGRTTLATWWMPPGDTASRAPSDDAIRAMLIEASHLQLVSDVPLGAFLSGGIDSAAISALAQHGAAEPLRTFCVGVTSGGDERTAANSTARALGTRHRDVVLDGATVGRMAAAALDAYDQPSLDGLNTYVVSGAARADGLTVALSGAGGDELFAGYDGFARMRQARRWGRRLGLFPAAARDVGARMLSALPGDAARKSAALLRDPGDALRLARLVFTDDDVAHLAPDLATHPRDPARTEAILAALPDDDVNAASRYELQGYLVNTLLRDADQMSMAHALEVRVPLLDPRLVELVLPAPGATKLGPPPKPLLVRPLGDLLPPEVLSRPKRGFDLGLAHWCRTALAERIGAALRDAPPAPFDTAALQALHQRWLAGQTSWGRVWTVLCVRHWLERHGVT